ncbi:MAG: hypothetical protein CMN55_03305 [Sneathiella sp.]|nr:hypothetical protein [Sneathiella sp.]
MRKLPFILIKVLGCLIFAAVLPYTAGVSMAGMERISVLQIEAETPAHGGGCRKSSPPGQCCHKDNRTGEVHCH